MIPFGNETVTLVRRTENVVSGKTAVTYSSVKLTGCSWRRKNRIYRSDHSRVNSDNVVLSGEEITCRVPADQTRPRPGDLMILGDVAVTVQSGADYQRLIEQYSGADGAFVVTSVSDNARPGMFMPHYAAKGA